MAQKKQPKKIIRTDKWPLNPDKDQRQLLSNTVQEYRRLCRYLVGVVFTHWPELGGLESGALREVEKLMHPTSKNPDIKYPQIAESFHKFPSYYRRAAINFALGQVSSFVTRYREWQCGNSRNRRDAKPPRLNADAGCYPTLYKGQCYKLHGYNFVEIKVFTGTDWIWTTIQITGLRELT